MSTKSVRAPKKSSEIPRNEAIDQAGQGRYGSPCAAEAQLSLPQAEIGPSHLHDG